MNPSSNKATCFLRIILHLGRLFKKNLLSKNSKELHNTPFSLVYSAFTLLNKMAL